MQTTADIIPLFPFYPGLLRKQGLSNQAVCLAVHPWSLLSMQLSIHQLWGAKGHIGTHASLGTVYIPDARALWSDNG